MKVKKTEGSFALVEAAGLTRRINIEMLPNVKLGDYVIVHAGFAIQKIDSRAARQTLRIFHEIR